jgi:hypothetical protein
MDGRGDAHGNDGRSDEAGCAQSARRQSVVQPSPELLAHVPEYDPEPTPDDEKKRERCSPLDMLFREAEVIAQNLKESGTRR